MSRAQKAAGATGVVLVAAVLAGMWFWQGGHDDGVESGWVERVAQAQTSRPKKRKVIVFRDLKGGRRGT